MTKAKTIEKPEKDWVYKLLAWREKHIPENIFVGILAFIVGVLCSIAAFVLKSIIHWIQDGLANLISYEGLDLGYLIFPMVGILLSGLFVIYIVRDDISHGVTKILFALSQRKSRIKPHNTWTSLVASSITIGFGGSVGAEAPIVLTGSAIGSNIGRLFRLEHRNLMLLVGCGAAGAVAGIFKAPITGLLFVIEVLMMDLTLTTVMPLLISSVTAASISYLIWGTEAMFPYQALEAFTLNRIPMVILLGILCGLVALYFTKISFGLERRIKMLPKYGQRFLVSAVILSFLIFFFPPLHGEGYITISQLIEGDITAVLQGSLVSSLSSGDGIKLLPIFLLLTLLMKVFATVATNAGGGCGGVFAPSLFNGALIGFLFSYVSNWFDLTPHLPTDNFTLMGMAGVMAGVMHAPLTGTFLIAELTGGFNLFLPLLIVSISAYATVKLVLPHSIYALRLAEEGKLLTHEKDQAVLTLMQVEDVIEDDFSILHPDMTLGDTVRVFGTSKRNLFPVLDKGGHLVGIVLLDNIRNIMFRSELYDRFRVSRFMVSPPVRIVTTMSMDDVMGAFEDTGAWNLPVEDPDGKYLGFVSKSQIFNQYREVLNDNFSE